MEEGPVQDIFDTPRHPYTQALPNATPGRTAGKTRLTEIPGASPNPANPPAGCPFHPRCALANAKCGTDAPMFAAIAPNRAAACWRLQ